MTRARRALALATAAVMVCGVVAAGARQPRPEPVAATASGAIDDPVEAQTWVSGWNEAEPLPPFDPAVDGETVITPPPVFEKPAKPPPPPPPRLRKRSLTAVRPKGGIWAVIIGVNDYPGSRADLQSAVADADDADQALGRFGVPPERRLVLRDGDASAGTIARAADWLVAHAASDATAVFFYAGHVRELSRETEAIVGSDGGLLTDAQLAAHLAPLRAKHLWMVMATCFGGGFTEALGPGRVLTAAADGNSLAYENSGFGRSYLGEYLVRRGLIQGAGGTTVQSAYAYARAALERDYPNRVPFQVDKAGESVSLVMGGKPQAAGSAPPTPPPRQAPPDQPPPQSPPPERPPRRQPPKDDDDKCAGINLAVVDCR